MKLFSALVATALLFSTAPAFAQEAPGGVALGAGLQRGVQGLNNSGQAGYVTLFRAGAKTRIVTAINGTGGDRVQTVAIQRGKSCDSMSPGIVARSTDLVKGMSRGMIDMTQDRLTSGNYVVVVYSTNKPGARPVACGELYRE